MGRGSRKVIEEQAEEARGWERPSECRALRAATAGRALRAAWCAASAACAGDPPPRELALLSLKLHQPPPIALVRPAFRSRATQVSEPVRLPQLGPPLHAHWRLGIVLLRLGRRPSPLRQAEHVELGWHAVQHQAQPVPTLRLCAGFTRSPLMCTLPPLTAACAASERCLDEPRAPQPFIDAVAL